MPTGETFVVTFPLKCDPHAQKALDTQFKVANFIKNGLINLELKKLKVLQSTRAWRANEAIIKAELKKPKSERNSLTIETCKECRKRLSKESGFSRNEFQKQAKRFSHHYQKPKGMKGYLVPADVVQNIADEVYASFAAYIYGKGKEIQFSSWKKFFTLRSKSANTGYKLLKTDGFPCEAFVVFNDVQIPIKIDRKDKYGYQAQALNSKIVYCSISRRWYTAGWMYFAQVSFRGKPPIKTRPETGELLHPLGDGVVGHDIGTQTIASVSEKEVALLELAPSIPKIDAELRRVNRAMDRSRRATNPCFFNEKGEIISKDKLSPELLDKRGKRKWVKSKRYLQLEAFRRELYRRQREARIQQHDEIANKLIGMGSVHNIEEMRFRALMKRKKETSKTKTGKHKSKKRFGKSISNKAPATFVKILQNKVIQAGGVFNKVDTYFLKASQFNHLNQQYAKKSLSQRWNNMPDGNKLQRDLYSAFLIMNADATLKSYDQEKCNTTYPEFVRMHDIEIQRLNDSFNHLPSSMGIHK